MQVRYVNFNNLTYWPSHIFVIRASLLNFCVSSISFTQLKYCSSIRTFMNGRPVFTVVDFWSAPPIRRGASTSGLRRKCSCIPIKHVCVFVSGIWGISPHRAHTLSSKRTPSKQNNKKKMSKARFRFRYNGPKALRSALWRSFGVNRCYNMASMPIPYSLSEICR